MAIKNQTLNELQRIEFKSLESKFITEIRDGLNCSPFESEAVLDVVKDVFFPFLANAAEFSQALPPGMISLTAIDADEPSGKLLSECQMVNICLQVHRGRDDDRILNKGNAADFRVARIPSICQSALSQGALLTREDIAYRIFFVSTRTISRDLKVIRESDPNTLLPIRSNKHDIGPVLTHRVLIVKLALEGKTFSQIQRIANHSTDAIANYIGTFSRCAQLHQHQMEVGQIGFLLRRGRSLIQKYVDLIEECKSDKNMQYHLAEMMLSDGRGWLGNCEKKSSQKRSVQP